LGVYLGSKVRAESIKQGLPLLLKLGFCESYVGVAVGAGSFEEPGSRLPTVPGGAADHTHQRAFCLGLGFF
jgi:hypothetical protein